MLEFQKYYFGTTQGVMSKQLEHHSESRFSSSDPEVPQLVLCGWIRNLDCQQAPRVLCFCSFRTAAGRVRAGLGCGEGWAVPKIMDGDVWHLEHTRQGLYQEPRGGSVGYVETTGLTLSLGTPDGRAGSRAHVSFPGCPI